jgi:hypothetical protein
MRQVLLVVLLIVGVSEMWGAFSEGLYYIKSNSSNNYFLCPSIGCYYHNNVDQPHLTTFKTSGDQNSIWKIVPVQNEDDTYYIIHYKTGRYLKSNEDFTTDNGTKHNRKAVHLEVKPETLTDDFKFLIKNNSSPYHIYPKEYYTSASDMSFNPTNGHKDCYAPANGEVQGMIGLYQNTDNASKWLIPSVPNASIPCATPTIKYAGNQINISYPYSDETGITIYYTTDGTEPSTSSSSNTSTSFNISASGVVKVRAFAAKSGYANSDEAVLWGSARPFLVQSKECSDYYLVPSGNGSNVNTSSIPGTSMQWTLQNAGASTGGVPYYYLVNSNNKKIQYATTFAMNEASEDDNKFCIIENGYNTGDFFLIPISQTERVLYKTKGNATADNCRAELNKTWNTNYDQWNLVTCNDGADQKSLFAFFPFSISDNNETHYYHIASVGSDGYYIVPPFASDVYATMSNSSSDYTDTPWLFKVAATDNWLTYYYIINAASGKYMHFNIANGQGNKDNALSVKDVFEKNADNEERFQFIMVRSTTANAYFIVPKGYANNFNGSNYYGIYPNGVNPLKATWSRISAAATWTFNEKEITDLYLTPVFSRDGSGNISITYPTAACDIYYTTDGTNPTTSSDVYNNDNGLSTSSTPLRIEAAAKLKTNSSVVSNVATLLYKPNVTITGSYVYKGEPWEPNASEVSIGEGASKTTAPSEAYTVSSYSNNTNVGTASATVIDADPSDAWYLWDIPDATFTIDKAPLTITANDHTIYYGDMPANYGVSYTGFVHDETEAVLGGTLTYAYNYEQFGHISDNDHHYTITPSGLSSLNYLITYVPGTLTVDKKSIGQGALAPGFTVTIDGNNIILKDGDIPLGQGTDFSTGDEITVGKYTGMTINGEGNYIGYFEFRNASVNFQPNTYETEWAATFVAEQAGASDIGHALPEGVTAYIITGIQDDWAIPEELDYIPKGIPVVLVSDKAATGFMVVDAQSEDVTAITPEQISNNMLEMVTETTPNYNTETEKAHFNTRTIYLLHNDEFVYNLEGDLGKGMVYLNPNHSGGGGGNGAPARLRIKRKDDTGIDGHQLSTATSHLSDAWYTLDGRRLNAKPMERGLYINERKKIFIK